MIEAELHGKSGDEDRLTSAVLGLLQYVPVVPFWCEVLDQARSLANQSFVECCRGEGIDICAAGATDYLQCCFWPSFKDNRGAHEPDVLVVLPGLTRPVVFLIEVKLWSEKSSVGKDDQLIRYLACLRDDDRVRELTRIKTDYLPAGLIYLTPFFKRDDIEDAVASAGKHFPELVDEWVARHLFLMQWQDIHDTASTMTDCPPPFGAMLERAATYLVTRGLRFFCGFDHPIVPERSALLSASRFYLSSVSFKGFRIRTHRSVTEHDGMFYRGVRS